MTLVELLVVMVLLGVVGGVVVSAIVTGFASASTSTNRTMAVHDLEVALQRVGRDLRAADPIYLSATGDYRAEVGAEYLRAGMVNVVRFGVETDAQDRQRLVQQRTQFDLDDAVTNPTAIDLGTQTLVTDIDNGDEPLFRYFRRDGSEITCQIDEDEGVTQDDCDGQYAQVSSLEIRLIREVDGQSPVRATTRVSVRNTRYGS